MTEQENQILTATTTQKLTTEYEIEPLIETPVVEEYCEVEYSIKVDVEKAKSYESCMLGLSYVMGFIARKFAKEFPDLGSKTGHLPYDPYFYTQSHWIFHLSEGGLTAPSDQFLNDGKEFERLFNEFHGLRSNINRGEWVISRFTDVLKEKFGEKYDSKVLALFSKTRTFIRIRDLNLEYIQRKREKVAKNTRDYKQLGQLQSIAKKSLGKDDDSSK